MFKEINKKRWKKKKNISKAGCKNKERWINDVSVMKIQLRKMK